MTGLALLPRRTPDPETLAARADALGRSNTRPAREAWERALAAEFGITDAVPARERERRIRSALRIRMAGLARARWGSRPRCDRCGKAVSGGSTFVEHAGRFQHVECSLPGLSDGRLRDLAREQP
jgi:hypothetical protein